MANKKYTKGPFFRMGKSSPFFFALILSPVPG